MAGVGGLSEPKRESGDYPPFTTRIRGPGARTARCQNLPPMRRWGGLTRNQEVSASRHPVQRRRRAIAIAAPRGRSYNPSPCGDVAQLGERRVRNAEVVSSILIVSTRIPRPTVLRWPFCLRNPAYTWGAPAEDNGFESRLPAPPSSSITGFRGEILRRMAPPSSRVPLVGPMRSAR